MLSVDVREKTAMNDRPSSPGELPQLDEQLREAIRKVATAERIAPQDIATVQELVDRKADKMRSSFSEKIRRLKAATA